MVLARLSIYPDIVRDVLTTLTQEWRVRFITSSTTTAWHARCKFRISCSCAGRFVASLWKGLFMGFNRAKPVKYSFTLNDYDLAPKVLGRPAAT